MVRRRDITIVFFFNKRNKQWKWPMYLVREFTDFLQMSLFFTEAKSYMDAVTVCFDT